MTDYFVDGDLRNKRYLIDLGKSAFVREITDLATDLIAPHPFREGNGRSIRLSLIWLADIFTDCLLDHFA